MQEELKKVQIKSVSNNETNKVKKHLKKPSQKFIKKPTRTKLYEEKVVSINRVTKVTKGGRQFRFSAIVLIGDKKGKVGLGLGKANEVPDAIKKAIKTAEKSLINIPIVETTIPHEVLGHHGGGKVLIKPAKKGKGIISGGSVRLIMELSGIKDVYSKSLGSNTPINMIRATLNGFSQLKTEKDFLFLRDKLPKKEIKNKEASKNKE